MCYALYCAMYCAVCYVLYCMVCAVVYVLCVLSSREVGGYGRVWRGKKFENQGKGKGEGDLYPARRK